MGEIATLFFFLAVIHVFLTNIFRKKSKELGKTKGAAFYGMLGNITLTFGLWLIPVLIVLTWREGFSASYQVLTNVDFREPFAYFVLLSIASIHPIRKLFDTLLHRLYGKSLSLFWFGVILISSILSGVFSGIAIMALACWLLSASFFHLNPKPSLAYVTLALLLTGISLGSTILPIHFGPFTRLPIEGRAFSTVFMQFGWKALIALPLIMIGVQSFFRKEFKRLEGKFQSKRAIESINLRELFYLALFFLAAFFQTQFYVLFLLLCVVIILHKPFYRKKGEERNFSLYLPVAVAFFTYTLEVHATLQTWWVAPIVERAKGMAAFLSNYFLTGLNEHIPLSGLTEVWSQLTPGDQFFSTLGLLCGGGLTIIATSANILAKLQLRGRFPHRTIAPLKHFLVAIPIGIALSVLILLFSKLAGT